MLPNETHFKYIDIKRLKGNGYKKILQESINFEKLGQLQ